MSFDTASLDEAWTAIMKRLQQIYGTKGFYQLGNPLCDTGAVGATLGPAAQFPQADCSEAPFQAVCVFDNSGTTPSHWHYVTFGLSDLFARHVNVAREAASGFGFELTMRVPREEGEKSPPYWPVEYLCNFAAYVMETKRIFALGHFIDAGGPILRGNKSASTPACTLEGFAVAADPELGTIYSASGKVEMLQLVGLTREELEQTKKRNSLGVLKVLAGDDSFLMTDHRRPSIMQDTTKLQILARAENEGDKLS